MSPRVQMRYLLLIFEGMFDMWCIRFYPKKEGSNKLKGKGKIEYEDGIKIIKNPTESEYHPAFQDLTVDEEGRIL